MREFLFADHGFVRACYDNTHEIAPGVFRSFQPSPEALGRWAKRGLKTVVNLRGANPCAALFLEEEACARHGLRLENFRVFSREAPSKEIILGARALFDRIERPALFHCKSGADRVGVIAALYLFFKEKRPLDEALKQLSLRYGHVKHGKTGVIDAAFERYLAHARAKGISLVDVEAFLAFVQSDAYDPAAIKRDFMGSWWGNFLTERILRRE
ncbi:MAG: tyrosine-protein phosphatase [Parvularculaceae bacterium]|nr:tyrosine-protein phosphatase [Parvularculaceae bacterium]